jgi:hypothetical protein
MIHEPHQGRHLVEKKWSAMPPSNHAQRFSDGVGREMKKMPRGEPQAAFKDFVTCYLITHKQPERFHQIHRAEAALPQRSVALQAMSEV